MTLQLCTVTLRRGLAAMHRDLAALHRDLAAMHRDLQRGSVGHDLCIFFVMYTYRAL